ncbi:hypothetical protein J9332_39955, partial [Aquimarina celericrescens]|nr:hypothetical protein [Aquimarina celericrescens]
RVLGNLGYVQWLRNRENENSEELLIKALEIQKEINDVLGSITNNIYLTKYYFERNKDKALQHAEAAYYNAKKQHSLAQLLESLGFIFKLRENTK